MTTTRLIENLSEFSKTVSIVLCLSAVTIFQRFRKPRHHRQYQQHKPTRKEEEEEEEEEATKITTSDRSRSVAMQFKVVVPEECSEGETFRVILADGTEANVTIPEGLSGGDTFVFEVPTNQMKNPGQLIRDFERHQKEQQQQKEEEQQQQQQQQQQPKSLKQSKSSKRKQKKHQPNNPNAHPITEIETITHHHHPNDGGDSGGIPTTTASLLFHEEGSGGSSGGDGNNPSGGPPTKPGGEDPRARRPVGAALAGTIHFEDFLPALAVGLLVGSGIVVGFLAGILHATEAIYAVHPIEKPKQLQRQRQRQLQQKSSPIQPGDLPASALPSEMG